MKALIIFFVLPLRLLSQDLSGIWTGYMETRGNNLQFELLVSDGNGKITGYALTVFTINGIDNIGIKSIKLKKKDGYLIIEDDELVYNNYATPPKRIKQISTLKADVSSKTMSGDFRTRSLDFRSQDISYTGTIILKRQNDNARTTLIKKLDELNLLTGFAFIQPEIAKKEEIASTSVPEVKPKVSTLSERETSIANNSPIIDPKSTSVKQASAISPPKAKPEDIAKKEEIASAPEEKSKTSSLNEKETGTPIVEPRSWNIKETPAISPPRANQEVVAKKEVIVSNSVPLEKSKKTTPIEKDTVVTRSLTVVEANPNNVKETSTISPPTKKLESAPKIAAAEIATRKTEIIRSVFIMEDSISLSLYDNGVVDGDTVSVVLNGKVIIAKEQLTTNPIRAVIHLTPELGDSLQLVMYAENMGSIPPNTGLLFVQDGANRYEIRFEGDMKKSSAIILRRRH